MPDAEDLAAKVSSKIGGDAALAAGKAMAKRALDDLMLSPEEKQKRDEEQKKKSRNFKIKLALGGVVAVAAVLSVMSLMAALWKYALVALVVGGVGTAGYFVARPRIAALKQRATARLEARRAAEREEQVRAEKAAAEKAAADAAQQKKQKLEDELAALKQKV